MGLPTSVATLLPDAAIRRIAQAGMIQQLEEIRITAGQPLLLLYGEREFFCPDIVFRAVDLEQIMLRLTQRSLYAYERELSSGYLTVSGGHRVGFCGTALGQGESIRSQRDISSINIRLARAVQGCADELLRLLHPYAIWEHESLLILSPPGAGKTTLLRDLIRALSEARAPLKRGYRIGVVDERSELAAMQQSVAQHDLGPRTFVLNASPKREGLSLLLRSMAPQILATDELGGPDEWHVLNILSRAGVGAIFTVHGMCMQDLEAHPGFEEAEHAAGLRTVVVLGRTPQPGTLRQVWRRQEGRWYDLVVQDSRSSADSDRRLLGRRKPATGMDASSATFGRTLELR